jgi:hypothetical protein
VRFVAEEREGQWAHSRMASEGRFGVLESHHGPWGEAAPGTGPVKWTRKTARREEMQLTVHRENVNLWKQQARLDRSGMREQWAENARVHV